MSENYIVFIEQPIKMDLKQIILGRLVGRDISKAISWDPKQDTRFHLINKKTGKVLTSVSVSLQHICSACI